MQLLHAVPRDIHCLFDIGIKDLNKLALILDNMEVSLDRTIPEHVEAEKYLMEVFYPTIQQTIKEVEDGFGSDTK